MAEALPWIIAAVSAAGAMSSANAQSRAASYNAAIAQRNAGIAQQQGESDAQQQRTVNYLRLSKIKAATGASGIGSEGSPLDLLESSAAQAELDVQNIRYNASLKALGYSDSANINRTAAGTAQEQGLYSAAAAGLTGYTQGRYLQGTGTQMKLIPDTDYGLG